jgi:hypothetical protein
MKATSTFCTIRANVWTFGAISGFMSEVELLIVRFAYQFNTSIFFNAGLITSLHVVLLKPDNRLC